MRHELKYLISAPSAKILKSLLGAVLRPDPHYPDGSYSVCSLYFDDISLSAYHEKLDGTPEREKFRIRLYNSDTSHIVLEKKYKKNELVNKNSFLLNKEQAYAIIDGDNIHDGDPLAKEFTAKRISCGLKPSVTVKYDRTAFVFPSENTRITVDENIRFSRSPSSLFEENAPFVLLPSESKTVIEVKFDSAFPSFLSPILSTVAAERTAYSKYAMAVGAVVDFGG
ncbi:MAG: polyphosphate polymerase domain-containing protein [Clostridia bacterium]|nr:polyphosphate polymerase domain-containing protein [Clostridia bacterium]